MKLTLNEPSVSTTQRKVLLRQYFDAAVALASIKAGCQGTRIETDVVECFDRLLAAECPQAEPDPSSVLRTKREIAIPAAVGSLAS